MDRKDYISAISEFENCNSEYLYSYSQFYLGKIYLDKDGNCFNPERGIEHMTNSANAGNDIAAFVLGVEYLKGEVISKDETLGRTWINKSAEAGNEIAKQFLENSTYQEGSVNLNVGRTRAVMLCNAVQAMKRLMKDEFQKKLNEKEHERLTQQNEDEYDY